VSKLGFRIWGDLSAVAVDEVRGLAVRRQWRRLGCGWWAGGVEGGGAIEGVEEEEDFGGERKPCWKKKK
jgi:hypothetical protein